VFSVVVDPMGTGFINVLARPGGNATGFLDLPQHLGAHALVDP
jgi:hypothetical protein